MRHGFAERAGQVADCRLSLRAALCCVDIEAVVDQACDDRVEAPVDGVLERRGGPMPGERALTPWLAVALLTLLLLDVAHRRALLDKTFARSRARLAPRRRPPPREQAPLQPTAARADVPPTLPLDKQDPFESAKTRARRRQRL